MANQSVTAQTIKRLPMYLNLLKSMPDGDSAADYISATTIAKALKINDVVVRKDLASISTSGKPKTGYLRCQLIAEISDFLGYNNADNAIIVGAGRLGKALIDYPGFKEYGLNIVAAFDADISLAGKTESGKEVFHISEMESLCKQRKIKIGIITVPAHCAQEVCDEMLKNGITAIWNFAPVHLDAPDYILIQNENLAASFAVLSNRMKENLKENIVKEMSE